MTLTKRWAGAAALAVLLTGTLGSIAIVHAQNGPRGGPMFGGPGRGGPGMGLLRDLGIGRLDLADVQRGQLRTILQAHRDELAQVGARLRAAQKGLNEAVTTPIFDEATVRARSAEVAAVQADAAVLRAQIHGEVWALLTPEQQQKVTEFRAQMAQRFEQRRQRKQ